MVWPARLKDSLTPVASAGLALAAVGAGGGLGLALAALAILVGGLALARLNRQRTAAAAEAAATLTQLREANVVAEAATALLHAPGATDPVSPAVESVLADMGARLQMSHAPAPRKGEIALPLRTEGGLGWLYLHRSGPTTRAEAEGLLARLSKVINAAHEHSRASRTDADAEAARQADLAKTAVMHAVAHDLRVPLEALNTAAAALAEQQLSDDERVRLAAALARETAQLGRLGEDLLDLSRIEAGATNPQADWCDLGEVVAAAVARVRAQREAFDARVDLPHDLPLVMADRAQLERVFANLLDNAAKFCPSAQPVEVRGICANGRVTIRVLDHGQGISPAQQSQVFKAFVRGSSPASGSGLGLAICRGFVEANGGRITLQSGTRDGSAFAVSFPTTPQPAPVS